MPLVMASMARLWSGALGRRRVLLARRAGGRHRRAAERGLERVAVSGLVVEMPVAAWGRRYIRLTASSGVEVYLLRRVQVNALRSSTITAR